MNFGKDLDNQITAVIRLAAIGAVCIVAVAALIPVGLVFLAWWAWKHLTVTAR